MTMTPKEPDVDLMPGTLDLMVLGVLRAGADHGYAIARRIERASKDAIGIEEGSLYPALHRMQRKKWITSEWGISDSGRRAKFYTLSDAGRKELDRRKSRWEATTRAVRRVLNAGGLA
tara:strand:+ start:11668 stop:12021 length:354 start_codon:yes stop_codon:yes gene_type:complete